MSEMIRTANLQQSAFSTGFEFHYTEWTHRRHLSEKQKEMTVKAVFENVKEEVLESGFLSAAQWENIVKVKALKYMKMKRVKRMTAQRSALNLSALRRFEGGTPVTMEHLIAVILYCDFGDLCTAYSATYRLDGPFEDLKSLKKRHSAFAHLGRLLVELVLDFGINGEEWDEYMDGPEPEGFEFERGPFFCGLNCTLNIGSLAITLKGPCSTSTQREVAVNFAKSNSTHFESGQRRTRTEWTVLF